MAFSHSPGGLTRAALAGAALVLHGSLVMATVWPSDEDHKKPPVTMAIGGDYSRPMVFRDADGRTGTGLACSNVYTGVGLEHTLDGRVIAVQRGGPAWLHGVRVGHRMDSYENGGSYIDFVFTIDGSKVSKRIPTGEICQDEA